MWPHLESPVGQRKEDDSSNDEAAATTADDAEAESDSGDSLFITQVPEAVRAGRRRRHRQSDSTSSSSESDATSSSSQRQSKKFNMDTEARIKYTKKRLTKSSLPRYSFPFLKGSPQVSRSAMLPIQQNTSLHNSVMGGFFECVKEQWQGFLFPSFAASSLPTVDKEGQYIPPLTEDEEERSEDEDIKVVPKKCFVASTKAKSKQSWCNQVKEQPARRRRRREAVEARQETSQEGQQKMLPAKASTSRATPLSLDTERHDDEDSSCGVLNERKRNEEHVTNVKNCLTQKVTPRTSRYLVRTARKELCTDSDAAGCELQRSPRQHTRKGKAFTTPSDPQTDVSHTDDLLQTEDEPESQNLLHGLPDCFTDTDNDNVCDESTVKETEKGSEKEHESVEEEEPEALHAATSVKEELEETSSPAHDNWAEPLASQATDELEFNERNYTENVSLDDAILIQEEGDTREGTESDESDVRMEDSVFSVSCNMENDGKKRKRSREGDEDVEQSQSSDSAEIQKKRKKELVLPEGCEEEEASNRILDMTPASTGQSEKSGDNTAASEDGEDVDFSNDTVTSAKSTEVSLTKKKKKKTVSDGRALSDASVENEMFENTDNTQETTEGPEDENAELMMKKKTVSDEVDSCHTSEESKKLKHVFDTQKTMEGLKDQNAELETPRKRKKKKKSAVSDREDISYTLEENETINDVGNIQTESPKDQNVELETPKKKKKTKTVADEVDDSCTYEENEKIEKVDDIQKTSEVPGDENAELETPKKKKKKKKKKKTVSDEIDISYTSEENENIRDVDNTQKTTKSLEDENADLVTTKKKKKTVSDEVEPSYTSEENEKLKDVDNIQKMVESHEEQNTELETPKKKKKKKTVSSEVEISQTSQENEMVEDVDKTQKTTEGLDDQNTELVAMKKKKKKKKKKKMVSNWEDISYTLEENEKIENVDDTQKGADGPEDQNAELVTTEKKKKKKKKKIVSDGEDVSFTLEETEKVENLEDAEKTTESLEDENAELLSKKKKKTDSDGGNISNIPEENKRVEDVHDTEKAKEDLEGQDPERVTKKKKKTGEITSRNISEDSAAQSDDSVSVLKKEKKRTSSFLVADAEENNVQTYRGQKSSSQSVDDHVWCAQKPGVSAGGFETESAEITGSLEETNDGVKKKKKKRKRKRKMSVEQDSVEKDHEPDFEEPNKARLHETTNIGAKRKKKHTGNESEAVTPVERLENAADEEHRPTDEAVMLKKRKKCKDEPGHVIQDNPPAANEDAESEKSTLNSCSSASRKKKGKHLTSPLVAKDKHGRTAEELNMGAYTSSEQPENKLTDKKKKKKRKLLMMF